MLSWFQRPEDSFDNRQQPLALYRATVRSQPSSDPLTTQKQFHLMSAAFGNDDGDDAAVAVGTDLSAATSSASPPSPPGFSVGVAPGGGSIPASSDGYGFSSAMTEILHPDPDQMQREKGFILREWRRRGTFLVDPIIRRFAKMSSCLRRGGEEGKGMLKSNYR
ncbi:uncharacterized protein LOC135609019 [Musa acuminata AAA Group]|uniref:uncharacterized protein LOC135606081 n=1 Tax=Musa acuminata AAA Group TaxID=214697 RepID=UPI0031DF2BBF